MTTNSSRIMSASSNYEPDDEDELETYQQQVKQMPKDITSCKKGNGKRGKGIADHQHNADMKQRLILRERRSKLSRKQLHVSQRQSAATGLQHNAEAKDKALNLENRNESLVRRLAEGSSDPGLYQRRPASKSSKRFARPSYHRFD